MRKARFTEHQHGGESEGMVFITCFMGQASFVARNGCYVGIVQPGW